MPRFPPSPRKSPKKKSARSCSLARAKSPCAVITSTEIRLSTEWANTGKTLAFTNTHVQYPFTLEAGQRTTPT